MPYDNEYNRQIANDIMNLNQKYINHGKLTGQGMSGGFLGTLAGMVLPSVISGISSLLGKGMESATFQMGDARQADKAPDERGEVVEGDGYSGGALGATAGFAKGTHMDTGFERTIGAGRSGGVRKYKKRKPKTIEPVVIMETDMVGKGDCGCGGGPVSGAGMKITDTKHIVGSGKKQRAELVKKIMKEKGLSMIEASKYVKQHNLYKGSGMSGGTELGLPDSLAGSGKIPKGYHRMPDGTIMKDSEHMEGGALVPVANMKASYMAGQGRSGGGRSKRAEIVKKIMKEKGLSMIEASKYVKQHNLY